MFTAIKWPSKRRLNQEGFSFIELVIVVAVIGILTAIAIPSYGAIQSSAKQAAVAATAENGLRSATAFGVSGAKITGPQNLDETLAVVTGDVIDARYLDDTGAIVSNPSGDLCVWAFNYKELNADGTAKYQAFEGNCPVFTDGNYPTVPGDSGTGGTPGGGSGGDNGGNPTNPGGDTENPGGGDEGHGGDATAANAQFVLECDTTRTWTPQLAGFSGEQRWNDGFIQSGVAPRQLDAGVEYTVEMAGKYSSIAAPSSLEINSCLKRVNSWGSESGVTSLAYALIGPSKLEYVASPPSTVTSLSQTFGQSNFNGSLAHWDVSNITDFTGIFAYTSNFNQDLNSWDTSKVTTLNLAFLGAQSFNRNLNGWNTSNVTDMRSTFSDTPNFNGAIDRWNTSKVTTMAGMFQDAHSFNRPIGNWNVSNVKDMGAMFYQALAFDQPLNDWDISNVHTVGQMFATGFRYPDGTSFNQPLDKWDTSSITDMPRMFENSKVFDQDLSSWPLDSIEDHMRQLQLGRFGVIDTRERMPQFEGLYDYAWYGN